MCPKLQAMFNSNGLNSSKCINFHIFFSNNSIKQKYDCISKLVINSFKPRLDRGGAQNMKAYISVLQELDILDAEVKVNIS